MKKKVLIIDDEELIRLSLKEGLKDFDYEVETAKDGNEAIDKINYFRPDVALLDMKLKNENGLDIAKNIKKIDHYIEIIIMTAYGDIKTAIKAIKSEIEKEYIKKALDQANGNHTNASKLLGISRFALKRRLEKYFE